MATKKTKTPSQPEQLVDESVVMSQTVEDFKNALFIVSIAFNVAMFSIWYALQVIFTV